MIDFEISRAVKIWKDDSIVSEQDKMSEFQVLDENMMHCELHNYFLTH